MEVDDDSVGYLNIINGNEETADQHASSLALAGSVTGDENASALVLDSVSAVWLQSFEVLPTVWYYRPHDGGDAIDLWDGSDNDMDPDDPDDPDDSDDGADDNESHYGDHRGSDNRCFHATRTRRQTSPNVAIAETVTFVWLLLKWV